MEMSGPSSTASNHPYRHFDEEAFQHNCILTVSKHPPKYSGCHDLDCLLHAVAHGVVVASIDKLPGDGLPQGVYQIQMSCRKDVPTPKLVKPENAKKHEGRKAEPPSKQKKSKRKAKKCQRHGVEPSECQTLALSDPNDPTKDINPTHDHDTPVTPACTGIATVEYSPYTHENGGKAGLQYVQCPLPEPLLPGQRNEEARQEHGVIKFKLKPQLKTVYNPAIWTKEQLAKKCGEAFENAINGRNGGECNEDLQRWSGPFCSDYDKKTKYWFEGYYKVIEEDRKQILSFYFIHPDTLEKRRESKN